MRDTNTKCINSKAISDELLHLQRVTKISAHFPFHSINEIERMTFLNATLVLLSSAPVNHLRLSLRNKDERYKCKVYRLESNFC